MENPAAVHHGQNTPVNKLRGIMCKRERIMRGLQFCCSLGEWCPEAEGKENYDEMNDDEKKQSKKEEIEFTGVFMI